MTRTFIVNRYFHPDISATSRIASDLAFWLSENGQSVHAVASRLAYAGKGRKFCQNEMVGGVNVHRIWTTGFGRSSRLRFLDYLSFYISVLVFLGRTLRRDDVVIVKTDPPIVSVVAALAVRLRGATLINWLQDVFPEILAKDLRGPIFYPLMQLLRCARNWSLNVARVNVVIGERMAEHIRSQGLRRETITVIPNWADGRLIYPIDKHDNFIRSGWGLGESFVVAYSGNLGRVHDLGCVLEAAEKLGSKSRVRFVFVGGGYHFERLKAAASSRDLRNVEFRAYVPDDELPYTLAMADVHLVSLDPSFEGLVVPSKIYGIMAAGVAVINLGSRDGEVGQLLETEPKFGFNVEPTDAEGLVRKIEFLVDQPAAASALGKAARQHFTANFDRSCAMARWYRVVMSCARS